jgi:hypothetical protein
VGTGGLSANTYPTDISGRGESFLQLSPNGTNLTVTSWFTPFEYVLLNQKDWDLGSAGLLLIPNTTLAVSGGKQGDLYMVNCTNMGGISSGTADTNIVQTWSVSDGVDDKIFGAPVWWDGPNGSYAYVWPAYNDYLRQYPFNWTNYLFMTNSVIKSTALGSFKHPGGILSVSANGSNAGTGIVWASLPNDPTLDAGNHTVVGILRAYNAQGVTNELWDSQRVSSRDAVPTFAKFVPPTIANGKVYLATFSGQVNVYGLLPRPTLAVAASGNNVVLSWPTNFTSFQLQTNANVTGGAWAGFTNQPTAQGTNYQVTITAPANATYFRLKR